MDRTKKIGHPGDWWLVGGVVLAVLLVAAGLWLFAGRGQQVEVTVDGKVVETLPLSTDTTVTIPGVGGENTLVIANGTARVSEADCPDGLCVSHRAISRAGESIICLPHRVVVTVTGGTPAVDGEV